jgi:hypothetical protein
MIQPFRFLGGLSVRYALRAQPRRVVLVVAAGLVVASIAPAGATPLPLPSSPGDASPITVGAVLKAVDTAGQPLAVARFDVYRASQPDGEQHPILDVSAVSGGTTTVPLPEPSAIPDAASNYFVVSTGLATDGSSATGIDFFNLTAQNPIANATISQNLFQAPVTVLDELPPVGDPPAIPPVPSVINMGHLPDVGDPPSVPPTLPPVPNPSDSPTVPSVTNIGQLPPVGDVPSPGPTPGVPTPPVTGPCGFQPDTEHPPPPAFTITTSTEGVADGTVNVGVAHGTGPWPGNTFDANVRGEPYKVMGEDLESEWARATESSVTLGLDLGGATQTKYSIVGNLHFTLAASDVKDFASTAAGTSRAGQGARALVVPATWLHQSVTFRCSNGERKSETHELWSPHQWNPHISTTTPDITPDDMDSVSALEDQTAAIVYPLAADQYIKLHHGASQVYTDGYSAEIGGGPVGLDWTTYSQSEFSYTHLVIVYSADKCGTKDQPECVYWESKDAAVNNNCPQQMACGSDFYTATYAGPTAVPNPEPQPCSKYEPHGACD